MKTEDVEFLAGLAKEMREQDNLATAHPVWIVEERHKLPGVDTGWHDPDGWTDDEGNETDPPEAPHEGKYPFVWQWRFIQGAIFATSQAARDFITRETHNHGKMRTWCASMHRARELRQLFRVVRENF